MKVRFIAVLFVLVIATLLNVPLVQASTEPVLIIDDLFTALNGGEVDLALATFATNAIAEDLVRDETYHGAAEIRPMLQAMQREGRQYEIVRMELTGNTITLNVNISDRGQVWATETITAEVSEGKVQAFRVTALQLKLWRCPDDHVVATPS